MPTLQLRQVRLALGLASVLVSSTAAAQGNCQAAFKDSISVRTLAAFERVAAVPPIWGNYSLARHPLLLLADTSFHGSPVTPACAAIWRARQPLKVIELQVRPGLSTPLYGMLNLDPAGPGAVSGGADLLESWRRRVNPADTAKFAALDLRRAVILPVPLNFSNLGAFGKALAQIKADPARMQADLAVHESFHLHSQFPTWLDQSKAYAWPTWERQPDRAELRQRCYAGSEALSTALAAELSALSAAFDSLADEVTPERVDGALANARQFVALRADRRRLQDTMTVDQEGRRISCGLAEDIMELEEGSVQWLAQITTIRAGLVKLEKLKGTFASPQPETFYQFGPLQLLVLERLLGVDEMPRITSAIGNASGPDQLLFQQFDRETAQLAERRRH